MVREKKHTSIPTDRSALSCPRTGYMFVNLLSNVRRLSFSPYLGRSTTLEKSMARATPRPLDEIAEVMVSDLAA